MIRVVPLPAGTVTSIKMELSGGMPFFQTGSVPLDSDLGQDGELAALKVQ